MAEQRTERDDDQEDTTEDAATTESGGQSGAGGTGKPQGVTFTLQQQEYFNKVIAEERRTVERRIKESDEYKQLRIRARRADEIEGQVRQDISDLQSENARLKAERTGALSKAENALIRAQFTAVASQRGVPAERLQDAILLADKSSIRANLDDGTVDGVDEAVQQLVQSRPWLVGPGVAPQVTQRERPLPNLNGGTQGSPATDEAKIQQAMQEMSLRGFGRI